jgi:hypothetical protein
MDNNSIIIIVIIVIICCICISSSICIYLLQSSSNTSVSNSTTVNNTIPNNTTANNTTANNTTVDNTIIPTGPEHIFMDFSKSNISQSEAISNVTNNKKNILNNIACINNTTIIDNTNAIQKLILQPCQLVKSPDGNNFIAVHSDGSINGYLSITSNNGATWIAKRVLYITKSEMEQNKIILPWNCYFDINDNSKINLKDSSNNNSYSINTPT